MFFKNRHIYSILSSVLLSVALFSCVNDTVIEPVTKLPEIDLENKLAVQFSISTGVSASTKAEDESKKDYEDGDDREHYIDFEDPTQCYAIFFRDKKFIDITQLFYDDQIGVSNPTPSEKEEFVEYTVPVVAYIDIKDIKDIYVEGNDNPSLPNKVLVVLNGGLLKEKFVSLGDKIKTARPDGNYNDNDDLSEFLGVTWDYDEMYDKYRLPIIGINRRGNYVMTNSAYLDENGNLMTAAAIDPKKFKIPTVANLQQGMAAGSVYVERMVAKFSAPTFGTEVIGSDKVFRPSQNALTMVVYGWNGDQLISEEKNWRVHLIGWTINGRETSSYVFKNIKKENQGYMDWGVSDWNEPSKKRSFWTEDPHYENDDDFYPWQYRSAIDNPGHSLVSLLKTDDKHYVNKATLRYFSFKDINYWNDQAQTISENTFNPDKYKAYDEFSYDGRASLLVGPHLLVTAEIYIESNKATDDDYLGQFHTEPHIYSDRLRRFYLSERDWFKMFIRDFNRALETQEVMSFKKYNWDGSEDNENDGKTYTVHPTGRCSLYINLPKLGEEFTNKPLTNNLLDKLIDDHGVSISEIAHVKDGDGRLIPWIEGLVIRTENDDEWIEIKNENGDIIPRDDPDRDELRKSIFFEWFGPVDHYVNGYMYYAGDILHHKASNDTGTNFYGSVRNHWYKFTVNSINSLGIPIDDPDQPIIPAKYNYQGMISVYLDVIDWHSLTSDVTFID